ncbi:AraC family transcriptional regulator [Luteibacter sp. ME-Dv--P-043b]|uniref:helix-turn-helix transcriptional regulator n=1 Tax=Luteibacter sp. ME-Dv--P-043b TaxID=3040291 RepID=UPI0025522A86|nr:AraC family transcriptional regulator [Luteibacter sp. ME-Dv--P-043b]
MSPSAIHLRSYQASTGLDRHDEIQWVFSLQGEMAFEVSGRGGRLSRGQGVFVASGERHDQSAREPNRFLVIDCPSGAIDDATHEALLRQPWLAVPDGLLEDLMALAGQGARANVLPVLLAHFSPDGEYARLHELCARVEHSPGASWTVGSMSALAGLSISRLHAVFRAYFGMTPMTWLATCRLRHARHALESSAASLSDIALHLGYSEQSALTRAFRRDVGLPPGAWRRLRQ